MTDKDLIRAWKLFLADIGRSEAELSKEIGMAQQNINRKIKTGTIKYLELANILEKYGYSIDIHKK